MIPRLAELEPAHSLTRDYLTALKAAGFRGEVAADAATRLVTATDNSVYQILPQAVIYPKDAADVVTAARIAGEARFSELTFAPRGGGTGTNGQSLATGVIVDVSRHLNQILDVDVARGLVRVQPGVVLDQLNRALKPHGMFFAPNLSPSSRATIGGMISTDACGEGSRVHGRTSEHVLALECVLLGGEQFRAEGMDEAALAERKALPGRVGEVHRVVDRLVTEHAETITEVFPKLRRYMTGYNLAHVRGPRPRQRVGDVFDLTYLLCGSEGTLAFVTEAVLRLTPLPTVRRLVVLEFASFDDALASATLVAASDPSAIESIDDRVLGLARGDVVWHEVGHIFDRPERQSGPKTRAVNLVAYDGATGAELEPKVQALVASALDGGSQPGTPIGVYVVPDGPESAALWNLRKKGVGLLGNTPGDRKPIPFVEDTVVPPEHLAAYVKELRALLDAAGLTYGMFGHVDVGCLHVRPALDMKDPADERLLHLLSERVVELVRKYGGVIWGEHGKGFRSEYNPLFFGETLYGVLCEIKGAFDPENRLNPGKLAVPPGKGSLLTIEADKRGKFDRQIASETRAGFATAINCNGNGQCFDVDVDSVMCPSSKVTRDRIHSPKGRAGVMREWLRQLDVAQPGRALALSAPETGGVLTRIANSRSRQYDFSHEVYRAMDGCLACKACATQCPIQVDVPAFRSEFLARYHGRYLRPLSDHLVAGLEDVLPWMARLPRLSNLLSTNALSRWVLRRLGLVDIPAVATSSLDAALSAGGIARVDVRSLLAGGRVAGAVDGSRPLVFVLDAFTTYYEPHVVLAAVAVAKRLGRDVRVLGFEPSGKGAHVKGFLARFSAQARRWKAILAGLDGADVVGLDPAVTLVFRDELPHALGEAAPANVLLLQEWLEAATFPDARARSDKGYTLFAHCTERTAAPKTNALWKKIFGKAGLRLDVEAVGCCGMCGAFGHEARHEAESRGIYDLSWRPHLARVGERAEALATGYSCRSQVKRYEGRVLRHPIEVLAERLRNSE